jgi:hypothetical protein
LEKFQSDAAALLKELDVQAQSSLPQMNRTVLVTFCWFVVWTSVGGAVGKLLEIEGGGVSGSIYGCLFALMTTFAWPWILPDFIWNWMDR